MKYIRWKDLDKRWQDKYLEHARSISPYKDWTPSDDFLVAVCEKCGCPDDLMYCIYDKPANYGDRDTLYRCVCGTIQQGL